VTTADKVLSILGLFTVEKPEWTVEMAAQKLDLAVSTTYRYFRSLSQAGLLAAFTSGRYVLGPAITQYDRQMRLLDPLVTTAEPIMKRLAARAPPHAVVLLCRLYRDHVMCVHQESIHRPDFAISYERGRPMPLFRGAASKIILAHLPLRIVRGLHARHGPEMLQADLGASWEEVKARLRAIRTAGGAITFSELDVGMAGISAPVRGPAGEVVGSISFVIPARHLTQKIIGAARTELREASDEIHWGLRVLASGHADMGTPEATPRRSSELRSPALTRNFKRRKQSELLSSK
jgi:DNA-binding IclR family transcriptional regulator